VCDLVQQGVADFGLPVEQRERARERDQLRHVPAAPEPAPRVVEPETPPGLEQPVAAHQLPGQFLRVVRVHRRILKPRR